ncbi:MAG: hypothetical protein ACR2IE_11710 [Candidatus Sumerlaeaceae bacterium]
MSPGKQNLSPMHVCVFPPPPPNGSRTCSYSHYIHEILAAAGIFYSTVTLDDLATTLNQTSILLTVGEMKLPGDVASALEKWVESGGCWISVAGVCGLESLLGARVAPPSYGSWGGGGVTLGEGYLKASSAHRTTEHVRLPLHYFNGIPLLPADGEVLATVLDAHGRDTGRVALVHKQNGNGRTIVIAPDLISSIVRIQQGICVTRDGVSASDGTVPVTDNVLKSDDGCVLDWILDRRPVPGVDGLRAFTEPIADLWRELLLRTIFFAAEQQQVALPLLWLYPRNLPAIAHLSLDTDHNVPEQGRLMLDRLNAENVKATWCTILPGFPRELMRDIASTGHELAMHYDAMTEGLSWGRAEFSRQWRALVDLFDGAAPVTNKNHYMRWEGDSELWEWCEAHQIEMDQSKGASKTGEAGFNFGTCRPYYPVDPLGRIIPVLELPTPTQDLTVFGPAEIFDFLIDAVVRTHGILHSLFHPAHIDKSAVPDALRHTIQTARARGLEWWRADEINAWERARRSVRWSEYRVTDRLATIQLTGEPALREATILWLIPANSELAGAVTSNPTNSSTSTRVTPQRLTRWGFSFQSVPYENSRQGDAETVVP